MSLGAAEKVYATFKPEVTNPGGHSSLPVKDNAIFRLAEGLTRLARFDFPVRLFDVTRAGFERRANLVDGRTGSDMKTVVQNPNDAAVLRTTCVPTVLAGGHAQNALPQSAVATVNCRLLPIDTQENVEQTLRQVLADPEIQLTVANAARPSPYTPINPAVMSTVSSVAAQFWPGLPLIPEMNTGASDSLYLRIAGIPAYGVSGIFTEEDDVRAHGRDERVPAQSFYDAVDFMYALVSELGKSP